MLVKTVNVHVLSARMPIYASKLTGCLCVCDLFEKSPTQRSTDKDNTIMQTHAHAKVQRHEKPKSLYQKQKFTQA